jgi:hypothetical protein
MSMCAVESLRVPGVEADWAKVCVEDERIHLGAHGRNILFLKLSRQMSLYKGGLAGPAVA